MTPEQGIANLERIYKNFWWEFGLGIIEAIDLIIFIICVCVISIYDTASYWSAFGITLGICVLICIPMSYFFINSQHLFMSMPMPYKKEGIKNMQGQMQALYLGNTCDVTQAFSLKSDQIKL